MAIACGDPPEGRVKWTMRLLADRLVECEIVGAVSAETVRQTLKKKNELKPWLKECWCIPPKADARFVCAMEDVLDVYHRKYGDDEVLVCMDETSRQQVKQTRVPQPARPGAPAAYDYEYERNGTSNLFPAVRAAGGLAARRGDGAPDAGRLGAAGQGPGGRGLPGQARRAGDGQPEHAHPGVALRGVRAGRGAAHRQAAGDPLHAEARQLAEHGGDRDRRPGPAVPGPANPGSRLDAPARSTPGSCRGTASPCAWDWRFTTADARIKLKSLYPSIQM